MGINIIGYKSPKLERRTETKTLCFRGGRLIVLGKYRIERTHTFLLWLNHSQGEAEDDRDG